MADGATYRFLLDTYETEILKMSPDASRTRRTIAVN